MMYNISIIIPIYNAAQYLEECLDSVLAQTILEKEIICIDDGSTDETVHILQSYAEKCKNINVIHQLNQGAGAAKNVGLRMATGKYVCFLDADDFYIDSHALEKMVEACEIHGVKVCGSFRKVKCKDNMYLEEFPLHRDLCQANKSGRKVDFYAYQEDFHYTNYVYQRYLIEENHIMFPLYRRYEDPPFFLHVMIVARYFWVMPVELYGLRLGHQDFENYNRLIEHTLLGIRDNMVVAKKYNFRILQQRLLNRINGEFLVAIKKYVSPKILLIILEIQKALIDQSDKIIFLDEICTYYREDCSKLRLSCYINRVLLDARYAIGGIGQYLYFHMGIRCVVIYGMGYFGTAFYNELRNSKVKVVAVVDMYKEQCDGNVEILHDIKSIPDCDAVIISLLDGGEIIAENIRGVTSVKIYQLKNLVIEIEKCWR